MDTIKVAIIGAGNRGSVFGELMQKRGGEFEISALCDSNPAQVEKCRQMLNLPKDILFTSEEEFFAEKRGDLMVIATNDTDHVPQAVRAMNLGYDLLLEKPISDSREEIALLLETQKKTGRRVAVCHELRYGTGFKKLKELLNEGAIGELVAIDAMERVVYWHHAQAYVRIQSQRNEVTHPTILAKCSHDLDLLQGYAGAKCDTVSSVGSLRFFRRESAPEGSTEMCLDCPLAEECPYSAKKIYIDRWHELGCPEFIWPFNKVSLKIPTTEKDLYDGIRNSYFGKCVFRCGNEAFPGVVDHQIVQMQFENGVQASLKMMFASTPGRRINMFGTMGELLLDERTDTIEVRPFGKPVEVININTIVEKGSSHGGGDEKLVASLYGVMKGLNKNITSLEESVESHLMGIAAEESRRDGGALKKVHI